MMGANLGGLAGAKFAAVAVDALQPVGLMVVATAVLALTLFVARPARAAVPEGSLALSPEHGDKPAKLLGGIELVMRDRYLSWWRFVVLLNWINSTGEFVLADLVTRCRRRWRPRPARSPRVRSSPPFTAISSSG